MLWDSGNSFLITTGTDCAGFKYKVNGTADIRASHQNFPVVICKAAPAARSITPRVKRIILSVFPMFFVIFIPLYV